MVSVCKLDLNNEHKGKAKQSVIKHLSDLYDYIEQYNTIPNIEKVIPIELAVTRAKITNKILENIEVILYGVQNDTASDVEVLREPQAIEDSRPVTDSCKKIDAKERLAMIMKVFGDCVSEQEKKRLRIVYHDLQRKKQITEGAKK